MKKSFLTLVISISLAIATIFSQSYDPNDISALREIKNSCNSDNKLNWDKDPATNNFIGIVWDHSTPKRVVSINLPNAVKMEGELDIRKLTNLQSFSCLFNSLRSINASGLTSLTSLSCSSNSQLESIDLSNLPNLKSLNFSGTNISTIDLSALTSLETLNCTNTQLTNLNLSGLSNLKSLNCSDNIMTVLDVYSLNNLELLNCQNNKLTSLKFGKLSKLKEIYCSNNQLENLDVSGLSCLSDFYCEQNKLINLDISALTELAYLDCSSNELTSINSTSDLKLSTLICNDNHLQDLSGISKYTNISYLDCSQNELKNLKDISNYSNLSFLYCSQNEISRLDEISSLTNIMWLNLSQNQISSIKALSNFKNLSFIDCSQNKLTTLEGLTTMLVDGELKCEKNNLPFSQLAQGLGFNLTLFSFDPQDTIFASQIFTDNTLIDYSSEALIDGVATSFSFYKNKTLVETNTTGKFTTTGDGEYYCKMSNDKLKPLVLITATTTISATKKIVVSITEIEIDYSSGSTGSFTISSNTTWEVKSSENWLKINPSSGSDNKTITLTAEANAATTSRTSTVTVTAPGVAQKTIIVTQASAPAVLSTSVPSVNLSNNGGNNGSFAISSNATWEISSSENWLTAFPLKGSNNGDVTLTAEDNPNTTPRTATITISFSNTTSKAAYNNFQVQSINTTTSNFNLVNDNTVEIKVTQAGKTSTGVNEPVISETIIYPNPVTDVLKISLPLQALPATINIFSLHGKQLLSTVTSVSITEIKIHRFAQGNYLVKIQTPTQEIIRKIIIQH